MKRESLEPAFPCVFERPDGTKDNNEGINKREYFASRAPVHIPHWFDPDQSYLKEPEAPMNASEMKSKMHDTDRETLVQWTKDRGLFSLPEHLQWYEKEWREYDKQMEIHKQNLEHDKYFSWRYYYADQMLNYSSRL